MHVTSALHVARLSRSLAGIQVVHTACSVERNDGIPSYPTRSTRITSLQDADQELRLHLANH